MAVSRRLWVDGVPSLGRSLELTEEALRHARVLRLAPGDTVVLFDGAGGSWDGVVRLVDRRRLVVEAVARRDEGSVESPIHVTVLQGLARGHRMDEVVRHGCELGVAVFEPVVCTRSTRRDGNVERWRCVARDAARQCGRLVVPDVADVRTLAGALDIPRPGQRLHLSAGSGLPLPRALSPDVRQVTLLVGPEGGFDAADLRLIATAGYQPVTMGPRTLRTETAALAAVAAVQCLLGDWR